ncbi:hypothetical protein KDV41_12350 [Providencia stuartii]|uniref:DUF7210 family protein n=1 Tax=Providencia TaxID=586 RepID=UPI001238F6AB|nr:MULTISPECIES: hypothetical protein [Providencia]MDE8748573.1 hypothetical protein [Providencia thailandensis]MDE8767858.1 hypothetical protein [Providencia thailandensis]MDE8780374.1 hypothetical protein [Providencia thailandensis]MDE8784352.1 hypothetical protein [Providencia thailandensis]MDE8788346.1 hypothetical protein [Providencia thailandensis]
MKLKLLRPICFGGGVAVEGDEIETTEQHGRELIQKGYASDSVVNHATGQSSTKQTKAKKEK